MKYYLLGILLGSLSMIAMDSYSMDYIEIEKLRIMEEIETELFIMNNRAQNTYYDEDYVREIRKEILIEQCQKELKRKEQGLPSFGFDFSQCK